jgi:hypothetical protein
MVLSKLFETAKSILLSPLKSRRTSYGVLETSFREVVLALPTRLMPQNRNR